MKLLEDRIREDGVLKEGNIVKVDSFLNHQIDVNLVNEMGKEWKKLFKDKQINKILTIEASGIGIACIVAQYFNVPVVFAKKVQTSNISNDVYTVEIESYTHKRKYNVMVSKEFLKSDDRVLVIDDFLANGCALKGLISLIEQADAKLEGIGIGIEKGFQKGGKEIRDMGVQLESLAIIEGINNQTKELTFR